MSGRRRQSEDGSRKTAGTTGNVSAFAVFRLPPSDAPANSASAQLPAVERASRTADDIVSIRIRSPCIQASTSYPAMWSKPEGDHPCPFHSIETTTEQQTEKRTMKRTLMLSFAAGALALGLSFGTAQAAMPVLDATLGVDAGAGVTPVQFSSFRCRWQYRSCLRRCNRLTNPNARRNCVRRCAAEYRRCQYRPGPKRY